MKSKYLLLAICCVFLMVGISNTNPRTNFHERTIKKLEKDNNLALALPESANIPFDYNWIFKWDLGKTAGSVYQAVDKTGNSYIASRNIILKINSSGELIWNNTIEDITGAEDILIDSDNNIYVVGANSAWAGGFLVKLNSTGYINWSVFLGSHVRGFQSNIAFDSSENIIVGSDIQSVGAGYSDIYIAKYNSTGHRQWQRWWGTSIFEFCHDIILDSSDNIYTTGHNMIVGQPNSYNILVCKFNSTGHYLWDQIWGGSSPDRSYGIDLDSNEDIWVGGYTSSYGAGSNDVCLLKYNDVGTLLFDETYGTTSSETCRDIKLDFQDNIYIVGNRFMKIDKNGVLRENITFNDNDLSSAHEIGLEYNGSIYLSGPSSTSSDEICVVRYDLVPKINVISPEPCDIFENPNFDFNISIDEPYLDTTWYCLNGGINQTFNGLSGTINQSLWDAFGNGTVLLRFYANNTFGYTGYEEIIIYKDIIAPNITINNPLVNQIFSNLTFNYNLLIQEGNLNSTWYCFNNGINYTFTGITGDIDQVAWDACGNGSNLLAFYANDSMGNLGVENITIYKDISIPEIFINAPVLFQVFGNTVIDFNISLNKPYLDSTWYSLNGGNNFTFTGSTGTIDQIAWDACGNGSVDLFFYANNTFGDIVYRNVTIYKDTHIPNITIYSPFLNQLFGNISPNFSLMIEDSILNDTWYVLNDSATKIHFSGNNGKINQTEWDLFGNGTIKITFYANNTLGNLGQKNIFVFKDIIDPQISIISPIVNQKFGNTSCLFQISVIEVNLNETWYTLNNGIEYFFVGVSGVINQTGWDSCSSGIIQIRFYANDSMGNIATERVDVEKDSLVPEITIQSPKFYQLFGYLSADFEITINEQNLNKSWYTLNNGPKQFFVNEEGIIEQEYWNDFGNGTATIRFYANDTLGNLAWQEVTVRKDLNIIYTQLWEASMGTGVTTDVSDDGKYSVVGTSGGWVYLFSKSSSTPIWSISLSGSVHSVAISSNGSYIAVGMEYGIGNGYLYLYHKSSSSYIWRHHEEEVLSVGISSDGNYIVSGDYGGYIRLFQRSSSAPLWVFASMPGTWVSTVAISSDGNYITAGSSGGIAGDQAVYLFHKSSSTPLWVRYGSEWVRTVAISSDGSYIVAGGRDNRVRLFQRSSSTALWSYNTNDRVETVAISATGYYIVAGSDSNRVYLFRRISSTPLWSFNIGYDVETVSISSCGTYIAAGGYSKMYFFKRFSSTPIWSYDTGATVRAVSISSNGRYIAGGGEDAKFHLFQNFLYPKLFNISSNADNPDSDGSFTLTWVKSELANDYSVYRYHNFISEINGSVALVQAGITGLSLPISGLTDGTYYYKVVAFNECGNVSSNCISVVIDVTPPSFSINSPGNNDLFELIAPNFNLWVNDTHLDKIWYTLNGGEDIIIILNGTIDQGNWTALSDGYITITFYANDTAGNINSSSVIIIKDTTIPQITIINPINSSYYNQSPSFDLDIFDYSLNSSWYTIDNGQTNNTFIGSSGLINQSQWQILPDGLIIIAFYVNDSFGRMNFSSIIVEKDTVKPEINVIKPKSKEHYNFNSQAPEFIVEFSDLNLAYKWYAINGMSDKYFILQNGTIEIWESLNSGEIKITFYANDSVGNLNYFELIVFKDSPEDKQNDTTDTINNVIIIIVVSVISAVGVAIGITYTRFRIQTGKTKKSQKLKLKKGQKVEVINKTPDLPEINLELPKKESREFYMKEYEKYGYKFEDDTQKSKAFQDWVAFNEFELTEKSEERLIDKQPYDKKAPQKKKKIRSPKVSYVKRCNCGQFFKRKDIKCPKCGAPRKFRHSQ